MKTEKEPLPVCETGNGENGQLTFDGVRLPASDSTTARQRTQGIAAFLLRGSANAIPLQHLQTLTGIDGRTIRRLIQRERQAGACICVNNRDGYFLAKTVAERDACARSMQHRAGEIERTAQAIAAAEVPDG